MIERRREFPFCPLPKVDEVDYGPYDFIVAYDNAVFCS